MNRLTGLPHLGSGGIEAGGAVLCWCSGLEGGCCEFPIFSTGLGL
jgi:hypothetical protein